MFISKNYACISSALLIVSVFSGQPVIAQVDSTVRYLDANDGHDWPGYGRTFGQQHYTPLAEINEADVSRLGLVWSMDLDSQNSATQPIAVDGVLYFATGLSVVHAVDVTSGRLLWQYDPRSAERAGLNLRLAWGTRGIAWWNGKIYTGTQDGRLIAIDAKTGKPVWTVETFDPQYPAHINGAPRVFNGRVIIGYASTTGATRGYVTTYDAETGKQMWRFYTVPGNPADGFENRAMEMAAKTWAGEWWRFGGGADVWNSIAYDPETDTLFVGTGSGYPWNRRVRSLDRGDNLFVASIVALDGKTGAYRWHYQVTPGDTWDYDATMDIELADLVIQGKRRKVLLQAPKNGFFYVIDRLTGALISAEPYTKVTWASRIDLKSGRPVETPVARYQNGTTAMIWPVSAHSWMPMAYSPETQLAYIPVIQMGGMFSDANVDLMNWRPPSDRTVDGALGGGSEDSATPEAGDLNVAHNEAFTLVAWNPVTQKAAWKVSYPTYLNGGVLATAGGLVFQGTIDGTFKAYSASSGNLLWSFSARAPLIATPISYLANGHQYVTLLTGLGMNIAVTAGSLGEQIEQYGIDPRSQARRVLTFSLGGKLTLPPSPRPQNPPSDPEFKPAKMAADAGKALYYQHCVYCHGISLIGSIHAPDLRRSPVPVDEHLFSRVVREGALISGGMPAFGELTDNQLSHLRQYIRTEAQKLRSSTEGEGTKRH